MTDKEIGGGPAFPGKEVFQKASGEITYLPTRGMSLRDWFAGMAMQGMAAGPFWAENLNSEKQVIPVALVAYQMADAMLAERAKS